MAQGGNDIAIGRIMAGAPPATAWRAARRAAIALLGAGALAGGTPAIAQQLKLGPAVLVPVGRLFIDHASYQSDRESLGSDTRPTSLRLGVAGSIGKKTHFLLQYELREWFKTKGQGKQLRYAFVTHQLSPKLYVDVGQLDQPFALEGMATSKNMTFMEWGLPIILVPYYHFGTVVSRRFKHGAITAGYFGKTLGQKFDDAGHGGSVRAFFSPIHSPSITLHVGASAGLRHPKTEVARFSNTPESAITKLRLVDTGPITGVDSVRALALESALIHGPLSLQGELVHTTAQRRSTADAAFTGGYAYASYILTGEQRAFDQGRGAFGSIGPLAGAGAVELAGRVSFLDLDDGPIRGGRETNYTLGLNWYVNRHARLMLNFVSAHSTRNGQSDNPTAIQTRLQLDL